jgi:hypothetical protein
VTPPTLKIQQKVCQLNEKKVKSEERREKNLKIPSQRQKKGSGIRDQGLESEVSKHSALPKRKDN